MDGMRSEVTHGGEFWGLPVTLVALADVLDYADYLASCGACVEAFCVSGRPGEGFYCVDTGGGSGDGEFRGLRAIGEAGAA